MYTKTTCASLEAIPSLSSAWRERGGGGEEKGKEGGGDELPVCPGG